MKNGGCLRVGEVGRGRKKREKGRQRGKVED